MPTRHRIVQWWAGSQGRGRIDYLQSVYGDAVSEKLRLIDLGDAFCWACNGPRHPLLRLSRRVSYRSKQCTLERCHVIPVARGGSNHPCNLVMMCKQCHKDNPDSVEEGLFWWWFGSVQTQQERMMTDLKKAGIDKVRPRDYSSFIEALRQRMKASQPVLVSGQLSRGYIVALTAQMVSEYTPSEIEDLNDPDFFLDAY